MPKTKFSNESEKRFSDNENENENNEISSKHVLQAYTDCDSDEEDSLKYEQQQQCVQSKVAYVQDNMCSIQSDEIINKKMNNRTVTSTTTSTTTNSRSEQTVILHKNMQNLDSNSSIPQCLPSLPQPSICSLNKNNKNKIQPIIKKIKKNNSISNTITDEKMTSSMNTMNNNNRIQMQIICAKRVDSCFFCLKAGPQVLVPACKGWLPHTPPPPHTQQSGITGVSQGQGSPGIHCIYCTYFFIT